jgi:hypothetical protein
MSENTGRIFTVIGIITVVYVAVRYVIPLLLNFIGKLFIVGFIVLCAVFLIYIIGKIAQSFRDRS